MNDPVKAWCATLGGLLNPAFPGEAMVALSAMVPHLRTFAPEVFTPESARRVASAERYGPVPSWDVIEKTLRQYAADAYVLTPPSHRIEGPREPEYQRPGPEEISRIMATLSRFNAQRAADAINEAPAPIKPIPLAGEALRAARIATGIYPNMARAAQETPPC
jgi:hypothetical protein